MIAHYMKKPVRGPARWLLLVLLIAGMPINPAFSNEGHSHGESNPSGGAHKDQGPHGGTVATLGSYHVEMAAEAGGIVKVFLYDLEDNPVRVKGIDGQVHLSFPDSHRETQDLVPAADGTHLAARLKDPGHPNFKAVLSLVINGRRQNVRLNL